MAEETVRFASNGHRFASQIVEQAPGQRTARAAIGVDENRQLLLAHALDLHKLQDSLAMPIARLCRVCNMPQLIPRYAPKMACLVILLNELPFCRGQHCAIGSEKLEAVPRRRVVARGNLNAAG